jgi:hypothetical protein
VCRLELVLELGLELRLVLGLELALGLRLERPEPERALGLERTLC